MQCKDVASVLEREGFMPVPQAARAHLADCGSCQSLVADLTEIVATAHLLPTEVDPPERVWQSLKAQLESEGIIKTPGTRLSWWQGFSELFRTRALATVTVGFIIIAAIVIQLPRRVMAPVEARNVYGEVAVALTQDERGVLNVAPVANSALDASLRQNLEIVDSFIADCEERLKAQPDDDFSREYLDGAYRQKAELLSVMMDREGGR